MKKLTCRELGVTDCDYTATGKTAGDVVHEIVKHLRAEHDMNMPDADVILAGKANQGTLKMLDPSVSLVIERLTSALNLIPLTAPEKPMKPPPGGTPAR